MADDADLDLALARRRRQQKQAAARRRLVLAVGLLAFLAVAAGVGLAVAVRGRGKPQEGGAGAGAAAIRPPLIGGPSPGSEGEKWDHRELADYLRSRGVPVVSESTETGTFFGPACLFRPEADRSEVYVQKRKSAQEAKDEAGTGRVPAFAWGRFLFEYGDSSAGYAAQIRSALGAR